MGNYPRMGVVFYPIVKLGVLVRASMAALQRLLKWPKRRAGGAHAAHARWVVLSDDPAFDDYVFTSTFDIHPNGGMPAEHKAMGDCIALVMTCDAIMLDHGWLQSKGCNLEYRAAKI